MQTLLPRADYSFQAPKATIVLFSGDSTHPFQERRDVTMKRKNHLHFEEVYPPIAIRHPRAWAIKGKNLSIHDIFVVTPRWFNQLTKIFFHSLFIHFNSTLKQHDFLRLQRRFWVVSRFWTRINYLVCIRSCPGNDLNFPKSPQAN